MRRRLWLCCGVRHSVHSEWVVHETHRANKQEKLICLHVPGLDLEKIPGPFMANQIIHEYGDDDKLLEAIGAVEAGSEEKK